MTHRGEIVKQKIENLGFTITHVASKLDIDRQKLYRYFENATLKLEIIMDIGKIINYDFAKDIRELSKLKDEENISWKLKYMELSEKYIQVMEENAKYMKKGIKK